MEKKNSKLQLLFMFAISVLAWAGLVLQFYLSPANWQLVGISSTIGTIRFFSYFTILSNIIVAISLSVILFIRKSALGNFFSKPSAQTAVAVYIVVVGITYNLLLRNVWSPQGLQLFVDNDLHVMIPFLYLIYWLIFVPKEKMKWNNAFNWLIYPALYFIWILIFGAFTKYYPYPFVDVNILGYPKMFLHACILLIVFLGLGFLAIALKKPKKESY